MVRLGHVGSNRDLLRRGVAGGEPRRQPLDDAAHGFELAQVAVERRDAEPPALARHGALRRVPGERLAHGGAPDARPLGRARSRPAAAGPDVAPVDLLED
jgi:hypothetical protein